MQDLTNFEGKVEKLKHSTVLHKSVKLVESCMNSWMDLQVNLSELVAAHLVYVDHNVYGLSCIIQCDISIFLKRIKQHKS